MPYNNGIDPNFFRGNLAGANPAAALIGQRNYSQKAGLNYAIVKVGEQGIFYSSTITIDNVFAEVANIANAETRKYFANVAKLATTLSRQRSGEWQAAFDSIGREATAATAARYKRMHGLNGKNRGTSGMAYRADKSGKMHRYAGGVLANALSSDRMYLATPTGLAFVNTTYLDARAKQWARLNFGVSPRGDRGGIAGDLGIPRKNVAGKSYSVKFAGAAVAKQYESQIRFGFSSIGPRDPFIVPKGLWMTVGGTSGSKAQYTRPDPARRGRDAFEPGIGYASDGAAGGRGKVSQGIAAWGFLNSGAAVIARDVPSTILGLVGQGIDRSFKGNRQVLSSKVGIPTSQLNAIFKTTTVQMQTLAARKNF